MTMTMRKAIWSTLVTCLLPVLACGPGAGPGSVVKAYQNAIQEGDYEAAYALVSSQDRAVRSQEEFVSNTRDAMALFGGMVDRMSFEITDEQVDGDQAIVALTITRPAVEKVFGELMGAALASALGEDKEKSQKELQEALRKKIAEGDVPMTTDDKTYRLVREEDGWKIVFGWRAEQLVAKARELRRDDKLDEALATLEEALTLDPDREEAKTARDEVAAEVEAAAERRDYRESQVTLEGFRIERKRRFGFGDPEPAVVGTLKNQGERTLSHVWVTVYFLGADGEPIAEKSYAPVSEYGGEGPLKPGYVRDFGYFVRDAAPSEWSGKARAEVGDIRFEEAGGE